jgi:AAA+ ATPase superfamily predicted ATPase
MAAKPASILDRSREWATLIKRWESDRPELVFVVGRRRVGKSHLLAPFARNAGGLYFQATRRTEAEQLASLSREAGETFDDAALLEGHGFRDWPSFFRYLARRIGSDRFVVVLDEYPYLEDASPGLASIVQWAWDHEFKQSRIKLVLAGSHVSAMSRLEAADQPLHARRTARIQVRPLAYFDAARFFSPYGPRDRLMAHGIFGGVPGNLALIDPHRSLAENVAEHVLDPTSRLFDEAEHVLDAFLGDSQVHYSVLNAIALGEHTWSGITKRVGRPSGSLSRPIRWLLEMGYVRRDVPVTVRNPRNSKRALYRIDDPYIAFWNRFVGSLVRSGVPPTLTPERAWARHIEPGLDAYMGPVFESLCRDYLRNSEALPFIPSSVGSWWNHDSTEDVDAVALGDGELLVAECKWGRVDTRDLETLRRRGRLVADEIGGDPIIHHALFAGVGSNDAHLQDLVAHGRLLLFEPRDLFSELGP